MLWKRENVSYLAEANKDNCIGAKVWAEDIASHPISISVVSITRRELGSQQLPVPPTLAFLM
jgi:hypothetical protein